MRLFLKPLALSLMMTSTPLLADVMKDYQDVSSQMLNQAEIALQNEKYDEAIMLFHQSIVANPNQYQSYLGLGKSYFNQEKYARALKHFETVLVIDPLVKEALEFKGMSLLKRHAVDQSKEVLERLREVCQGGDCDEADRLSAAIENYQTPNTRKEEPSEPE